MNDFDETAANETLYNSHRFERDLLKSLISWIMPFGTPRANGVAESFLKGDVVS
jgi:hypothetical protein